MRPWRDYSGGEEGLLPIWLRFRVFWKDYVWPGVLWEQKALGAVFGRRSQKGKGVPIWEFCNKLSFVRVERNSPTLAVPIWESRTRTEPEMRRCYDSIFR
jgi:hypothetical protein